MPDIYHRYAANTNTLGLECLKEWDKSRAEMWGDYFMPENKHTETATDLFGKRTAIFFKIFVTWVR